jgi:hypothetical protein
MCSCNCGNFVNDVGSTGKWLVYIKGHGSRGKSYPPHGERPPLCGCNICGLPVRWNKSTGEWSKFLPGHNKPGYGRERPPRKKCACQCGGMTEWNTDHGRWNKYIKGHIGAGITNPPVGESAPLCQCGQCQEHVNWDVRNRRWFRFVGNHAWNNAEHRDKMSEAGRKQMNKNWQNPAFQQMRSGILKKQWQDPAFYAAVVAATVKRYEDPAYRIKMNEITGNNMKKLWQDPEFRYHRTESARQARLKDWQNDEYVNNMIAKIGSAPNRLELLFDSLTNNRIVFVGDGLFWRKWPNGKNKNPDFLVHDKDGNPTRQIVELFGDYWHRNDDPFMHIEMWSRLNYEVLILWEHQIHKDQESTLDLVSAFIGEEARSVA